MLFMERANCGTGCTPLMRSLPSCSPCPWWSLSQHSSVIGFEVTLDEKKANTRYSEFFRPSTAGANSRYELSFRLRTNSRKCRRVRRR